MQKNKPLEAVKTWFKALISPNETFKKEKKNVSIKKGIIYLSISSLFSGLILGLLVSFFPSVKYFRDIFFFDKIGIPVSFAIIVLPIYDVIAMIVFTFLATAVLHVSAKMFKGNGNFEELFYFTALYTSAYTVLNPLLTLLDALSPLVLAVSLLSLYTFYPLTVSIKEAYQLSTAKAVLSWLIPFIILILIFSIIITMVVVPQILSNYLRL